VNLEALAYLAVALLALAAAFQVALAAGAPWGAAAYGGRADTSGVLPAAYRLGSGVAALVLVGAMWVVLASADVVGRGPFSPTTLTVVVWCLAALFALNTVGNARGTHPVERWGAGTVTSLLAVLCVLIASS
jgi:hypothetical protein